MTWRIIHFVLFQVAGGLLGVVLLPLANPILGALTGVVSASLLWVLLDLRRGYKVLAWLRHGDTAQFPVVAGLWGQVGDRARRLLRERERQLRDSENRLEEFLDAIQASPNGVVLLDAAGRIEWCNQTAAEHFGFDPARDVQQQVANLVRDPAFVAYHAAADYSHDVVIAGSANLISRPVRLSVHLHRYGGGRKLMVSRDVTAVEQAEAMRRDFVANVSHEIRTPLTVLGGFVETLQNLPLDAAERERYLALMAQQARRMQNLVNDLLTLSSLEGSPPPSMDQWVDVPSLLSRCEQEGRELSALVSHCGHELSLKCDGDWELCGSETELLSAMANLVNNAVRYTPGGGKVQVSWIVDADGQGDFCVTDSGPGIAAEHLPRLTERFYRVDRSRSRETGGTGLGLAIVKHVAQRHGARLRIDSREGLGATFSIGFPANRVRPAGRGA